jgi:hypothetical protein
MLLLKRFPLPPSSNKLYASVNGRLIKSVEGRRYDASVDMYRLKEFKVLDQFKETIKPTDVFRVDMYFIFMKDRLVSKKDTIKRLDSSNRIKQTSDGLAKIIDVDDCRFITGSYHKAYCRFPQDEQVIIYVKKTALLSLEESLDLIGNDV